MVVMSFIVEETSQGLIIQWNPTPHFKEIIDSTNETYFLFDSNNQRIIYLPMNL